jgi:hypothetical protein
MLRSSSRKKKSGIAEGLEATALVEVEAARTADMVNRDRRMIDSLERSTGNGTWDEERVYEND